MPFIGVKILITSGKCYIFILPYKNNWKNDRFISLIIEYYARIFILLNYDLYKWNKYI